MKSVKTRQARQASIIFQFCFCSAFFVSLKPSKVQRISWTNDIQNIVIARKNRINWNFFCDPIFLTLRNLTTNVSRNYYSCCLWADRNRQSPSPQRWFWPEFDRDFDEFSGREVLKREKRFKKSKDIVKRICVQKCAEWCRVCPNCPVSASVYVRCILHGGLKGW